MTKIIKTLFGVFVLCAAVFILTESYRIIPVFAQRNGNPVAQSTPGPSDEALPTDFNWDAFNQFEARLTQCEMVDALEWLPGNITRTVQIQRCIGPSPDIFLQNPNLESLPHVEDVPQPASIQPATIEAAPNPSQ